MIVHQTREERGRRAPYEIDLIVFCASSDRNLSFFLRELAWVVSGIEHEE
jgi:hypothetical protein